MQCGNNLQASLVDLGSLFDLLGQYPPKRGAHYSIILHARSLIVYLLYMHF